MAEKYIQMVRGECLEELLKHPHEFTLFALIAYRARRVENSINGLKPGESRVGDFNACGLSRQKYRTALSKLQKWNLITIKPTNKGTVITIVNTDIFDINAKMSTTKLTTEQPTNNHQVTIKDLTLYKEGINIKNERMEECKNEEDIVPKGTLPESEIPDISTSPLKSSSLPKKKKPSGKKKIFVKPTHEQIKEYAISINFAELDPERFYDHYQSKGWKIGKEPMKDWEACIRTWFRKRYPKGKSILKKVGPTKANELTPPGFDYSIGKKVQELNGVVVKVQNDKGLMVDCDVEGNII